MRNTDVPTVKSFGHEWAHYSQAEDELSDADRAEQFDSYFHIFPWDTLPDGCTGADVGCGSGRWATLVAPRVHRLFAADPAPEAVAVAQRNLAKHSNVEVIHAEADALPFKSGELDFAYCLGVLHHIPDTAGALSSIVDKLKPGAPLLLYLYYSLDNRPAWYRAVWRVTDVGRLVISRLPFAAQRLVTTLIAATVYWPLARAGAVLDRLGIMPRAWPLAWYADKGFYVMRTDSHDRFCTPLEKRFSRAEITKMMTQSGLGEIRFSDRTPHWVAVGRRKPTSGELRGGGMRQAP